MELVKQTAVEWLKGVIESCGKPHELQMSWSTLDEIIEQAKEMEKEQIENAYTTGVEEDVWNNPLRTGKMYYSETYGGENE